MMAVTYRVITDDTPNATMGIYGSILKESAIAKAKEYERLGHNVRVVRVMADDEDIVESKLIYESGE